MSAGTAVALEHEHTPTIASPRAVAVFVPAPRRADRRRVAELVRRRLGPPFAEAHDDAGSSWIVVGATTDAGVGWPHDAIVVEADVPPGGSAIGALREELDRLHPVGTSVRSTIREVVAGVTAPLVGAVVGFLLGSAAMLHVVGEYVS